MRWLRLLDRSKKRKLEMLKPDLGPSLNSTVDMETGRFDLDMSGDENVPESVSKNSQDDYKEPESEIVSLSKSFYK